MKVFIALAMLIAGISASRFPSLEQHQIVVRDQRLVTDAIASAIEDVSQSIKDAGLDPLYIKRETNGYALPVPVIFNIVGFVEELLSTGLSNIVINNINFGILTSRLTFDIELPLVSGSVDAANVQAELFGSDYSANLSGSVAIQRIRVRGDVRIGIGIITGISIRSLTINLTIGGINSNLNLVIQGTNYSNALNTFLGITVPNTLDEFAPEINQLLGIIVLDIIEDFL